MLVQVEVQRTSKRRDLGSCHSVAQVDRAG